MDCPLIIEGDCLASMASMEAGTVDLVVTDPPYNIGIDYGYGADADRREDYPAWCARWIGECHRLLTPEGSIWIVSGQEYGANIDLAMQAAGFAIRNRITWVENFGVYCRRKFGRCSRPILYGVKDPKRCTFNREAVLVPSARQTKYNDRRAAAGGKIMPDVWEVPRVCGTFRERVAGVPTQLPAALVRRIIAVSSMAGDLVLDPFSGSGTTVAVAAQLGRRAVGCELNPEYVRLAGERVAREPCLPGPEEGRQP